MRHQLAGRKLGRPTAHRWAMFRNMATALIEHGRIRTTLTRAKELRRIAEQLITLGKKNTVHARRQAFDFVRDRVVVQKLFDQITPAFKGRNGGYTRIMHLGTRPGDASPMALIEYLSEDLAKVLPVKSDKTDETKKVTKKKPAVKKEIKKEAVAKKIKTEKAPAEKKAKVAKKETKKAD